MATLRVVVMILLPHLFVEQSKPDSFPCFDVPYIINYNQVPFIFEVVSYPVDELPFLIQCTTADPKLREHLP